MNTQVEGTITLEAVIPLAKEALFRVLPLRPGKKVTVNFFPIPVASCYDMLAFANINGSWGIRIRDHRDPDKAEIRVLSGDTFPEDLPVGAVIEGVIEVIRRCLAAEKDARKAFILRCNEAGMDLDSSPAVITPAEDQPSRDPYSRHEEEFPRPCVIEYDEPNMCTGR